MNGNDTPRPWLEPELEARIVALVMGEASDFEREEIEKKIQDSPEAALFHRRMVALDQLLRESSSGASDEEWRLPEDRREQLLDTLRQPPGGSGEKNGQKSTSPTQPLPASSPRARTRGRVVRALALGAAACIGLLALVGGVLFTALPGIQASRAPDMTFAAIDEMGVTDLPAPDHSYSYGSSGGTTVESVTEDQLTRLDTITVTNGPAMNRQDIEEADVDFIRDQRSAARESLGELNELAQAEQKISTLSLADEEGAAADRQVSFEFQMNEEQVTRMRRGSAATVPEGEWDGRAGEMRFAGVANKGRTISDLEFPRMESESEVSARGGDSVDINGVADMRSFAAGGVISTGAIEPGAIEPGAAQPGTIQHGGVAGEIAEGIAPQGRTREWGTFDGGVVAGGGGEASGAAAAPIRTPESTVRLGQTAVPTNSVADPFADPVTDTDSFAAVVPPAPPETGAPAPAAAPVSGSTAITAEMAPAAEEASDPFGGAPVVVTKPAPIAPEQEAAKAPAEEAARELGDHVELDLDSLPQRSLELFRKEMPEEEAEALYLRFDSSRGQSPEETRGEEDSLTAIAAIREKRELVRTDDLAEVDAETAGKLLVRGRLSETEAEERFANYRGFGRAIAIPAIRQLEKQTADEPVSTFSLHAGSASFHLARAALDREEWPETGTVRIEEFVNAIDYRDSVPTEVEKVGVVLEQARHPFLQERNLLRVSLSTAAQGRLQSVPLELTLLLDNSGSMERPDRRETVLRAMERLFDHVKEGDRVTLIRFARTAHLVADRVDGSSADELVDQIRGLPSEGGTNLEAALDLAFEKALANHRPGAQHRVILLTDGAANLGDASPDRLSARIEAHRSRGIAFDAAGIGAKGLNDEILEALTRKGDGRYYLLDRPEDADTEFAARIAGALRPAAGNVKVQVEFNPKRVRSYRLLGFEKHRLEKEDFRDDTVDAAELAAAEAGVALYRFEPMADGAGDIGTVAVRFRDLANGEMVERRWPILHDPNAPPFDQAAPGLRIAGAAAFLGEVLAESPEAELVELSLLSRVVSGLPGAWNEDAEVSHLRRMIEQARAMTSR